MGLRAIAASFVFCAVAVAVAVSGCAQPRSTAAAPPAQSGAPKGAKRPFAGTVNVPRRRPVRSEEMTPEIVQRARQILDGSRDVGFGTEVPFEIDGQAYIGRIEEHYHEPGGPRKPWGRHRGVTVYHAE
jgi:hypothetical protein